jgi:ATP-dependent Clp protease ATP-binding subunit ClpX
VPPQGGRKHPHQEFLTIDTTNILFICGGAFADLEKIIERRIGKKGVGFGAEVESRSQRDAGELFAKVLPEDLLEFGLIPEFIGRLPVICHVHQLRKEDLVAILTEPKNALTKQYHKFFAYDGVDLIFAKDALEAIAEQALKLETGARGLRSVIESALTNVMFELPSRRDVTKCVVTREVIDKRLDPTLVTSKVREELELDKESA